LSHLAALADQPQLANALTIVRLSLHVLGASVWVGGQLVLGGLLGTVRGLGEDAPRKIARAFARLSWPAYWLLVATGVWNYLAVDHRAATSSWSITFGVKMAAVILAGVGTYMHTRAKTPQARGAYAAVGTTASVAAMVLGVALAG
jgi:putative copper export protein